MLKMKTLNIKLLLNMYIRIKKVKERTHFLLLNKIRDVIIFEC